MLVTGMEQSDESDTDTIDYEAEPSDMTSNLLQVQVQFILKFHQQDEEISFVQKSIFQHLNYRLPK